MIMFKTVGKKKAVRNISRQLIDDLGKPRRLGLFFNDEQSVVKRNARLDDDGKVAGKIDLLLIGYALKKTEA